MWAYVGRCRAGSRRLHRLLEHYEALESDMDMLRRSDERILRAKDERIRELARTRSDLLQELAWAKERIRKLEAELERERRKSRLRPLEPTRPLAATQREES